MWRILILLFTFVEDTNPVQYSMNLVLILMYFFRFIFLPENSTHLMQTLDVAVFAPMKRRWREVLREWKDQTMKVNKNYAALP